MTIHILTLSAGKELVFGLEWRSLIGSDLEKKSHQEAMRAKATHYIKAGFHSAAVGCVKLNVPRHEKDKRAMYSAAAVFALSNANGALITKVELEHDLFWVAGSHDGTVIKGTDVLVSGEEADALVRNVQERFPDANLISDERDSGPYLNDKTKLIEAKTTFESLPLWVKYTGCAFLILTLSKLGFYKWSEYQEQEMMANNIEQYVDVNSEWKKTLDKWAESIYVDGPVGYDMMFSSLLNTPLKIGGWSLVEATCTPVGSAAWACQAKYLRGALGTNNTFINELPNGWTAKWEDVSYAIGSWSFKGSRQKLSRKELTTIADYSVKYISELQKVLYAFKQVSLTTPVKVDVEKPKVQNSKGDLVLVPYPDSPQQDLLIPSFQKFSASGPLRSLAVFPVTNLTTIKRVHVAVKAFDIEPTLTSSALQGEISGVMYAK